jgi:hypothetical protein
MSQVDWLADFRDPPMDFRPVPFWSWNERLEEAELKRQLELFVPAGWGGAFIHSRVGLVTPYMGQAWFDASAEVIRLSKQQGLGVWLYDEDRWPSGYSSGTVPMADESYRMKALLARKAGQGVPAGAEPFGEAFDGVQMYRWVSPIGDAWFNGTTYVDLMSRDAVRCFIDQAYEPYYARFSQEYGKAIRFEFTDEPCTIYRGRIPMGAVPFTDKLVERFEQMHGYDPRGRLHLLFTDGEKAGQLRLHYFRTVNDLFETNFSRQLSEWCEAHGIGLTGHYMSEQGLYEQQTWGTRIMPNYRHQAIPGIDQLCRGIFERMSPKQCHSVVNQYNKPRMLSEMYGVAGQSLSFADRLWIASQQLALGVTVINPHLALYTMAGCRKRDFPQNMYYQQPWFEVNQVLDVPLSRGCVAMSQGRYVAEVLVIHPQESSQVLWQTRIGGEGAEELRVWDRDPVLPEVTARVRALNDHLAALTDHILAAQRTYDFGDEAILADDGSAGHADGRAVLQVGQMGYPVVIVPSMVTMAASTLRLLQQFEQQGGVIFRCGEAASLLDGEASAELQAWMERLQEIGLDGVGGALKEALPAAVAFEELDPEDARLLFVHVRDLPDGGRLVFCVNLHRERSFATTARFDGAWRSAKKLDIWTGESAQVKTQQVNGQLAVRMEFAPIESHLLLLDREAGTAGGRSLGRGEVEQRIELAGDGWRVERLDDNAITLDLARWREGDGPWSKRAVAVLAINQRLNKLKYDGPIGLRYEVAVGKLGAQRKVQLVVEFPQRYEIEINGQRVNYAGLGHWRDFRWLPIDITGLLREGDNVIEMRCPQFRHGDPTCYEDPEGRYGTEIEAIYLVGDFAVEGKVLPGDPVHPWWVEWGVPLIKSHGFEADSFVLVDPVELSYGDVVTQGLPFYAGRLRLSTKLQAAQVAGQTVVLGIDNLDCAVAEVLVDGRVVGYFIAPPLEVAVPAESVRRGCEVAVTLYGTLRNLLGPHHDPYSDHGSVTPENFVPAFDGDYAAKVVQWSEGVVQPKDWKDRYSMISFGAIGEAELRIRRASGEE